MRIVSAAYGRMRASRPASRRRWPGSVISVGGPQRRKRRDGLVADDAREQVAVTGGDPFGAQRQSRPVHERLRRPLDHAAVDDRRDGDDRRRGCSQRVSSPGTARIGRIEMIGFDGPITIASARAIASSDLRRRLGRVDAVERDVLDRSGAAVEDHELLERAPADVGQHTRGDRRVGHRQDPRSQPERRAEIRQRLGQTGARGEPPRALDADREVAVAEVEPDVGAELAQAVHDVEAVVAQAPAALVDAVGEPERAEVWVGRDVRAVDLDVVGGVGDHDQVDRRRRRACLVPAWHRRCRRRGRRRSGSRTAAKLADGERQSSALNGGQSSVISAK